MKRLVFTGYPCPRETWQKFLPPADQQEIVTFADVLEAVGKPDFKLMAKFAISKIEGFSPTSIVCHDYAVPYVLLALLKLKKQRKSPRACLTILNGAFRGFDVFLAPHPFRSQITPWNKFVELVTAKGGDVDPRFKKLNPLVRALYRRVILFNLIEKAKEVFKPSLPLNWDLGVPTQIVASNDDYFLPFKCMEKIRDDFNIKIFHVLQYGHFPYSKNADAVRAHLRAFES